MNVITLNLWGGKIYQPLMDFIAQHAVDTDIFCFQEVFNGDASAYEEGRFVPNIHQQLEFLLKNFVGFYSEAVLAEEKGVSVPYGLAMFVRRDASLLRQGVHEIFSPVDGTRLGLQDGVRLWNRLLQFSTFSIDGQEVTVFNFHGLYTGGGKDDDAGRLEQSEKVSSFIKLFSGEKVLCGDFNLNPETQSMKMLEDGMTNLVKQNGITSTRSHHYPKEPKFADYILVSSGIQVKEFRVLEDVVSDHLPLRLCIG